MAPAASTALRPSAIAALALAIAALFMTLPAPAEASPALPTVQTGGAEQLGYTSATLTGSVNPRGTDTSYYFQYGPTEAYGGKTAIADAGAGTSAVNVRLTLAGLQPSTVYHYRLIAGNGAVAAVGADRTLLTSNVPLSSAILAPLPLVPPGPFLAAFTFRVKTSSPHVARVRRVEIQAVNGTFSGGIPGEPELYLDVHCEYSMPCAPFLGGVKRVLGPPAVARVVLDEHERTRVTPRTTLVVAIERYGYVLRPVEGGSGSRLVDVVAKRLKFYALRSAGRTRLKLGQVREECLNSPVPSSVPPGESEPTGFAASPVYWTSSYVKVPCPGRWNKPGSEVLICPQGRASECVVANSTALADPSGGALSPRRWLGG